LGTDFLEVDSRNDIPLEGHQSLDISDFHTRSRPSRQGDVTSKTTKNRHALTTKNHFFPLVEGVAEGSADVAGRTLFFMLLEDEVVEFAGDGQAAAAPDQFAAWRWGCGLACGGGNGEVVCRPNETFYMIVGESVVEGLQPTVMVSEGDSPFEPLLFPTEREAQMEMADRMMTKLEEFIDGERDFDDAVALDEHVLEVVRRADGKIFPKDHAMPPGFAGW
jgi:hypothetical protein